MTRTHVLASVAFGMLLPVAAFAGTGTATTTSSTAHHNSAHHSSTKSHKVDLNTASKEDLMKLPGVDDATADKIIAGRPYTSKSELVKKNVLTQEEMKKIDAHVMAKAPAKEAAPKK
ncbi:MAG TPA: helix-hairpin-helix domain-containing protein [Candidatus Eisenbacteria bacterium]|jgi:DNA uptake protein ComE-like DNA-binding protein|nr:helix-hairpin-helix domain-containing protein [Candidatus Eisenbacteria bacterium]